jgi:hypothetical protein
LRRILASIGFTAFALAALIHVATFFGVDMLGSHRGLWIVLLVPLFGLIGARVLKQAVDPPVGRSASAEPSPAPTRREFVQWVRTQPLAAAFAGLFLYTGVNFIFGMGHLSAGQAEVRGHSFYLVDHGKVVREITESEAGWLHVYDTRFVTGHLMLFLFLGGAIWTKESD